MRFHTLIRAAENKYNRLLTVLILIYLVSPFLVDRSLGNFIVTFVFLGAIIVVVYQIQRSSSTLKFQIGLLLFALLLRIFSYLPLAPPNFDRLAESFIIILLLIFLSLSIYLILRELTFAQRVTPDLIKGGICVFFLFGFFWAMMYGIIYSFDANSFNAAFSTISRSDLNHFSFTTLTTVGYGDISPTSEIARVLANLEGMVGVMYPSIFIARLVSLHLVDR